MTTQVYQLTINNDRTIISYIEAVDHNEYLRIYNLSNESTESINVKEVLFLGWLSKTILLIQTKHELMTYDTNACHMTSNVFLKDKIRTVLTSSETYFDYVVQLTVDTIEVKRYYFLDGTTEEIMSVNTISNAVYISDDKKFKSYYNKYEQKIFATLDVGLDVISDKWKGNELIVLNKELECSIIVNGETCFSGSGYVDRAYIFDGYVLFSFTNFFNPRCLYKLILSDQRECFVIKLSGEEISRNCFYLKNVKKHILGDRQVPAVIIEPREFKLKTVLFLHGGPDTYIKNEYMDFIQPLIQNGIRVILVDYSGSISYGIEFYQRLLKNNGEQALLDIESVLTEVKQEYSQIFITGESFGGYLAILSAIKFSHIIRKAIAINGFTDYRYQYIFSVARQIITKYFDISISKNNPIDLLDKVSTISPIVFIHGMKDVYCPIKQVEVFVEKSKQLGYSGVGMIKIEGEGHYSMLPRVMEKFYSFLINEIIS
ncbi:alpha/beta hydrolase family protein [Streptococcus sciuri]|uniref:Prolyl oligopeptidase family serine peptidase n=1 Tax=Streptococcus sciuri TaxID=2973939 RepID=A0ABT2F4Z7_9STRE|nr:prolyl oligopeptidase family serine peptidase [Streptococcus sciuri]MCS4487551.1 prolyl oligopeptidase family serine peptidase [Streptococcus sciuri]